MTDIRSRYLITKVHFEVVTDGTRTILVQFTLLDPTFGDLTILKTVDFRL